MINQVATDMLYRVAVAMFAGLLLGVFSWMFRAIKMKIEKKKKTDEEA